MVTQAVVSPLLHGATLGLAKVQKHLAAPGIRVTARIDGAAIAGEVVGHPQYDPKRRRAKQS